jgi:hypothetical protein
MSKRIGGYSPRALRPAIVVGTKETGDGNKCLKGIRELSTKS